MPSYTLKGTELQSQPVTYEVDADNEDEALRKAGIGDTTFETNNGDFDVVDRLDFEIVESSD